METQEGGDMGIYVYVSIYICTCIADSLCYKAENNTIVKQLYSNKDV